MLLLMVSFGISTSINYCVYSNKKNLCIETYGIPIQENDIQTNITSPSQFQGVDLYINLVESISNIIDLIPIKNAKIYIRGINKQCKFGLESSIIATYDFLSLENVIPKKGDTTEFYIVELELKRVSFYGFQKASCFYSTTLRADLNSLSQNTFKADKLFYDVHTNTQFDPNYEVDGAVFTKEVIFTGFKNGSSIFQYGEQFIITPINESMGFRRTNFRPIDTSIKYTILHQESDAILNIGSWFSNSLSSFRNIKIIALNAIINVCGFKWSGDEILDFNLTQASLFVNDTKPTIMFTNTVSSDIYLQCEISISLLNLSVFIDSRFIGSSITLEKLYVSHNSILSCQMDHVHILQVFGNSDNANCSLNGARFSISMIDKSVSCVFIDKMELNQQISIGFNSDYPHTLFSNDIIIPENVSFKLVYTPSVHFSTVFYPLLTSTSMAYISSHIDNWIEDPLFPILGSYNGNSFGVEGDRLNSNRSYNICFSQQAEDNCGFSNYIHYSSVISLSSVLSNTGYPLSKFIDKTISIGVNLNNATFFIDVDPSTIVNRLDIHSDYGSTIHISNFLSFKELLVKKCFISSDLQSITIVPLNQLTFLLCNISSSIINNFSFDKVVVAEFDTFSFDQFTLPPNPTNLNIFTDRIVFDSTSIYPSIPHNQTSTKITLIGVNTIEGHGKYPYYSPITIHPDTSITLTTNSYGKLYFVFDSDLPTIHVYFKVVLPVNFTGDATYLLHPNWLGNTMTSTGRFCGKEIVIPLADKEHLFMGDEGLLCNDTININIPTEVTMLSPYVSGSVSINKLFLERQIYIDYESLLDVNELSIPDDDFLVYFNWTLNKMPFIHVDRFINTKSSTYDPSMQVYVYPSTDDEFLHSHSVFQMGVPFLCIYQNEYRGNLFRDGLIFRLQHFNVTMTTVFNRIAQEKEGDICVYMVPYNDIPRPKTRIGPANRVPWVVTLVVSSVLLLVLSIILLFNFLKSEDPEFRSELSFNLIEA